LLNLIKKSSPASRGVQSKFICKLKVINEVRNVHIINSIKEKALSLYGKFIFKAMNIVVTFLKLMRHQTSAQLLDQENNIRYSEQSAL
jgi:hypothetical protein